VQSPVVVVVHVVPNRLAELGVARKRGAVHELGLQGVEVRLHVGVVLRPAPGRALVNAQRPEAIAQARAHVLTAAIAVEDQAGRGLAPTHRGVEDLPRQARIAPPPERPGQHAPRALIEDHREEAPAAATGRYVTSPTQT